MAKSTDQRDVETAELLTGQRVFKGPRKLRNLLSDSQDDE